jgi:hypothetical protein
MMKNIKYFIMIVLVVDLLLIMISLYQGGGWLINSQLSFLSSLLVTLASYFSYKRVVEKRIALEAESFDDRDAMDKIDDPYDLYSEDIDEDESKDLKEVIKEERAKVTSIKQTGVNLAKTAAGAFSPFRLGSYLFLFMAFLYLVNNHLFMIWAYVSGLFVVPLSALVFALLGRK